MRIRTIVTKVRKCGKRKPGLYLVGGDGVSKDGVLARFTRISPPVPYQVKVHRSVRIVDAHAVLGRRSQEEWWAGQSRKTEEKKTGDRWALDVFGMTAKKRVTTGECANSESVEEALATLVGKITWSNRIVDYFRDLTVCKVQEIQTAAVHYEQLHEALHSYLGTKAVGDLIDAQAAVWRIAYNLPPRKRREVVPNLMRILVLMGLTKDATSMKQTFIGG